MRIFLDTANLDEIRQGVRLGVLSGVTTNPSLVAQEGVSDFREHIQRICSLVDGPVSAEVVSKTVEEMVEEGREISSWAPNVAVKLPVTAAGLEATAVLSRQGVVVNQTLCFSVNQALLAARAGASYVSPFVGRLDDVGNDGMQVVADAVSLFERYNLKAQVIAASLRHPMHCVQAAKVGAPIATMPFKVLMQMIEHPLTDVGQARFLRDWEKVQASRVVR
ncbi:MAG: fructose-6-phosphate aldolase [Chloroflexi bacterium]|nr:fructose-6-phosphate aldolase [Chloroflexota bacterium]